MKLPKPINGTHVVITPEDSRLKPAREDMKIVGIFNPGVTTIEENGIEKTLLMARQTDQFIEEPTLDPLDGVIKLPYFDINNTPNSPLRVESDNVSIKNAREISHKDVMLRSGNHRLRHISYPTIIVLNNGEIEKVERSSLYPCYEHERFGMEDLRLTRLDKGEKIAINGDKYGYIGTYVVPHRTHRVSTPFVLTNDFKNFVRFSAHPDDTPRPIIEGKDVAHFRRKIEMKDIDGKIKLKYWALTRPSAFHTVSQPDMAVAYSSNLLEWGPRHRLIESGERTVTGPGPAPFEFEDYWVVPYHEAKITSIGSIYRTRIALLDKNQPWKLIAVSDYLRQPNQGFNRRDKQFIPNVDYVMGAEPRKEGGITELIYGANDECIIREEHYTEDLVKFALQDK